MKMFIKGWRRSISECILNFWFSVFEIENRKSEPYFNSINEGKPHFLHSNLYRNPLSSN